MMDLKMIENKFNAKARFSERDGRIYVRLEGVRNAYNLKDFMDRNGFEDVYGHYDEGTYELGFKEGDGA